MGLSSWLYSLKDFLPVLLLAGEFGAVSLVYQQLGRISDPNFQLLTPSGEYVVFIHHPAQQVTQTPLSLTSSS